MELVTAREQPRKNFDEDALQELADSIKQYGIVEPLIVQDRKTYYEIIAGERRWRAAKLAGLKEVPVIVRNYTEQEYISTAIFYIHASLYYFFSLQMRTAHCLRRHHFIRQ